MHKICKTENGAMVKCVMGNYKNVNHLIQKFEEWCRKKSRRVKYVDDHIDVFQQYWQMFGSTNPYELKQKELVEVNRKFIECGIVISGFLQTGYCLYNSQPWELVE